MSRPLISIIVAIYKVEQYIPKCIESILVQTYDNFELLLVNDGSPDQSLEICNKYAQKDNRIKVLSKENGGQASARNYAFEYVQGEYIGYIDGDDWIEPEMYKTLYDTMIRESADIVQCGWWKVEPTGEQSCSYPDVFEEIYTKKEALAELTVGTGKHINTSVCCKLFKREIVSDVKFREVRAYEDDEFIYNTVSKSTKIVCINNPLYFYLNRENSTMTASFNVNKLALLPIQDGISQILMVHLPEYYNIARKNLCSKQFFVLYQLKKYSEMKKASEHFNRIKGEIFINYEEYMKNPTMGANKYMLFIMKYLPQFVWMNVLKIKFRNQ